MSITDPPNPLGYVGPAPAADTDLADLSYLQSQLGQSMTQSVINDQITTAFTTPTALTTVSFVDSQTALCATTAQTETGLAGTDSSNTIIGSNNLITLAGVGAASSSTDPQLGAVPLDASGLVPLTFVSLPASTQRWPEPFWTPSAYLSASATNSDTATLTQLFTTTITPAAVCKLLVTGLLDGYSSADGTAPQVSVSVTQSGTSQIVAQGTGIAEGYQGGVLSGYHISSGDTYDYPIPGWAATIDVAALGAGAGGETYFLGTGSNGNPGNWASAQINALTLPAGTKTLPVVVGLGGLGGYEAGNTGNIYGLAGGNSTVLVPTGTVVTAGNATPATTSTTPISTVSGGTLISALGGAVNGSYLTDPGGQPPSPPSYTPPAPLSQTPYAAGVQGMGGAGATTVGQAAANGTDGAVWLFAKPGPDYINAGGGIVVIPTDYSAQTALSAGVVATLTVTVVTTVASSAVFVNDYQYDSSLPDGLGVATLNILPIPA